MSSDITPKPAFALPCCDTAMVFAGADYLAVTKDVVLHYAEGRGKARLGARVRVRLRLRLRVRVGWRVVGSVLVATPDSVHITFIELQLLIIPQC